MMKEVERCAEALRIAASGRTVALVSGGDAGIYGMAGLVLELAEKGADAPLAAPEIVVIPGVSALQAAAAVLGAPLMHDFAVISLSDLMTPLETIEQRLQAAADADFVVALYNPRSKGRVTADGGARDLLIAAPQPAHPGRHRPQRLSRWRGAGGHDAAGDAGSRGRHVFPGAHRQLRHGR